MEYKSLVFIKKIVEKRFHMPVDGKLIQFGVDDGKALRRLCQTWGKDRVVGYDISPRVKHSQLITLDLNNIGPEQETQIAFCDVDVGDFNTHAELRLELVRWSAPQVVMGGMIMCNSPMVTDNAWQSRGHDYLIRTGFVCYRFTNYAGEKWYTEMLRLGIWNPATWCIYKRERKV